MIEFIHVIEPKILSNSYLEGVADCSPTDSSPTRQFTDRPVHRHLVHRHPVHRQPVHRQDSSPTNEILKNYWNLT